MKKLLFVLKVLCVCLCISALILMVGVANLDTITKTDLFYYSACGIIAVASFVCSKLLGKIKEQNEVLKHIDIELLKGGQSMNERVLNLLSMCLQATEKGHHVFLDYIGHVKGISFRAYKGKYVKGKEYDINLIFYTDYDDAENLHKIAEAEAYLKELLA